ncbi:MAG TPA: glutathione peroxidase [Tepidisphaeraceae bacterium]|jgi:glutathione peroxidase
MNRFFSRIAAVVLSCVAATAPAGPATRPSSSAMDFVVDDIDGKPYDLAQLKGKVVLIVNVASKCGFTKQYAGLEKLYEAKKDAGLVILGFPANDFGGQEPGTNDAIKEFCTGTYAVTFPMMSKITVKGADKAPLYQYLTAKETAGPAAGEVKWNFTKFLVGRDGVIAGRFDSKVKPDDAALVAAVDAALAAK